LDAVDGTPTDALFVDAEGEVGIGTTSAGAKLHVVNNAKTLRLEGTDHTFIEFYPDGPTTRKGYLGFPNAAENNIRITNEIASGHIILETAGGNVGIGTTLPETQFHIFGGAGGGSNPTSTSDLLTIENNNHNVINLISPTNRIGAIFFSDDIRARGRIVYDHGELNTDRMDFYTAGNNIRMTIDSSGNVGIGTTSPSTKLHVSGNARITGLVSCDTIDTDASGNLVCGTDSGGGGGGGWVDDGTSVRLESNADKVGIGTSSVPQPNKLHVVETSNIWPPMRIQNTLSTGFSGIHFVDSGGTVKGHIGFGNSGTSYSNQVYIGSTVSGGGCCFYYW